MKKHLLILFLTVLAGLLSCKKDILPPEGSVTELSLNKKELNLVVGERETLTVTVTPSDAALKWESDDRSVAYVYDDGEVVAWGAGTATVTVTAGDRTASCKVTVTAKENDLMVRPDWTESEGLTYGTTGTIRISNPSSGALSISSSPDPSIATATNIERNIDTDFSNYHVTITPVSCGETSISIKSGATADAGEIVKTVKIKVNKAQPVFSILAKEVIVEPGKTSSFTIDSDSDCTFTASSSNTSVATVSVSGKTVTARGVSDGDATVTVNCPETDRYLWSRPLSLPCYVRSGTDLSASGTANCYIVPATGKYKFKASVKGNSNESVGVPAYAEVLWESYGTSTSLSAGQLVRSVSLLGNYVYFEAAYARGNAVIAVKNSSGTILWSWHIWICEGFDPKTSAQKYNNNAGTVMDRNLGATAATVGDVRALGLLYQWGRKDPFPGGNALVGNQQSPSTLSSWPDTKSSSTTGTFSYAVQHPTTFIKENEYNHDWYYTGNSSTDDTRWQTSGKTKGLYDPCPAGWRVPDGELWQKAFFGSGTGNYWRNESNWNSTWKGMDFGSTDRTLGSGTIWYPAAGDLVRGTGLLSSLGEIGVYWSCSPDPDYAYYVDGLCFMDTGNVFTRYSEARSDANSVRCVQDVK